MQNDGARQAILDSIRRNLAASEGFDLAHNQHHARQHSTVGETLVSAANLKKIPLVERFRENLISIGGNCQIVENLGEAAQAIQILIEKTKACGVAVSDSLLVKAVCEQIKTDSILMAKTSAADLFEVDLGITGAQWAIAETGTLVLESDSEAHRLTSLVPPVHICVVEASSFRLTLGEALALVNRGENLSRTVTFITGPSRTSDIELTLAIGVHGPAELHVIVIAGENYD